MTICALHTLIIEAHGVQDATHADWNATTMKTFAGGRSLHYARPEQLLEILTQSFGHASDAGRMNAYSLKGGEFGIDGVISDLVEPLLDTLPLTHPEYAEYYRILEEFCAALATRLRTHLEVCLLVGVCMCLYSDL